MASQIEVLEARVFAAMDLIADLRKKVCQLESELSAAAGPPGSEEPESQKQEALAVENARLRSERALIRERIRGLILEIERAGS